MTWCVVASARPFHLVEKPDHGKIPKAKAENCLWSRHCKSIKHSWLTDPCLTLALPSIICRTLNKSSKTSRPKSCWLRLRKCLSWCKTSTLQRQPRFHPNHLASSPKMPKLKLAWAPSKKVPSPRNRRKVSLARERATLLSRKLSRCRSQQSHKNLV